MNQPFTPVVTPMPVAQTAANMLLSAGNQLYQQMLRQYISSYNRVWHNPLATPDAIVAAMGTNANFLFTLSAGMAAYLVSAGAVDSDGIPTIPVTMPSGWNYQANPDGSVTLTKS